MNGYIWIEKDGGALGGAQSVEHARQVIDLLAAPNPALYVIGNPGKGQAIGKQVDRIYYLHVSEGARVHAFRRGVRLEGLPDGSIRIYSTRGVRLWDDL